METSKVVADVRKAVTVPVPVEQAFAIFADHPIEWWPEKHVFVKDRQSITIEPYAGGRYYERGADGSEIDWGTVVEWDPPHRIVLTWRVGPGWQPLEDDEGASFIEVDFEAAGPAATLVALTHSGLERHGDIAEMIRGALDGPDPGETLGQYRSVVARRVPDVKGSQNGGPITLVNRFTVTGDPADFERIFEQTSGFFAAQDGFLQHTLMREVGEPASYVNIASWSDVASLKKAVAHPAFQPHSTALRAVASSEPKIFAARQHVVAPGD